MSFVLSLLCQTLGHPGKQTSLSSCAVSCDMFSLFMGWVLSKQFSYKEHMSIWMQHKCIGSSVLINWRPEQNKSGIAWKLITHWQVLS